MNERIAPPAELEHVLDDLRANGIFETKQKAIMFAAAVGRAMQKPLVDPGKQGEGIRYEYFERVRDAAYIDALAVTKDFDLAVLDASKDAERVATFEKYAAAGLPELKKACYDGGLPPLEGILALIDRLQEDDRSDGASGEDVGSDLRRLSNLI